MNVNEKLLAAAERGDAERVSTTNPPTFKTFLPGTGWCWMQDGEVIEIIDDSTF